jgi:cytochrome c-type biogenesis protein CcmE
MMNPKKQRRVVVGVAVLFVLALVLSMIAGPQF